MDWGEVKYDSETLFRNLWTPGKRVEKQSTDYFINLFRGIEFKIQFNKNLLLIAVQIL